MLNLPKRRFEADDAFFEEGTVICRLLQEKYLPAWVDNSQQVQVAAAPLIYCQIQGCFKRFPTITSYEEHYSARHRNVCQACSKVLPTQHLLDLHINELHNPMFTIQCRDTPMYQCLVAECNQRFIGSKERRKHLIKVHMYPPSFRFERTGSTAKGKPHPDKGEEKDERELMDTSDEAVRRTQVRYKYSYKVPHTLSFGYGVQKGFRRRRPAKGNHLTKSSTSHGIDLEDVNMEDLGNTLPDS